MVTFLQPALLQGPNFEHYQKWQRILNLKPGWHYPMDLVWILDRLSESVPPPARILDLGAGSGPLQFLLAASGYDVVSVDLVARKFGRTYSTFFKTIDSQTTTIETAYSSRLTGKPTRRSLSRILNGVAWRVRRAAATLRRETISALRGRSEYGEIELVVADVTRDFSVPKTDAIVSVSALEHIPLLDDFALAVRNVSSVGVPCFLSTSAARNETWFHEPSSGWCFGREMIDSLVGAPPAEDWVSEYDATMSSIVESDYLRSNIPSYYYGNPNCGLPYGRWDPTYVPIGLSKQNPATAV